MHPLLLLEGAFNNVWLTTVYFHNQECDVAYIPTSGLGGENLVTRSQSSDLTKWYQGKCLLEQIGECSFSHSETNMAQSCACQNICFGEGVRQSLWNAMWLINFQVRSCWESFLNTDILKDLTNFFTDSFKPPQRSVDKPFRLCVADVFKGWLFF